MSRSSRFWVRYGLMLWLSCLSWNANSYELRVAVASNFYHSLKYLLTITQPPELSVTLSSGSTGLLYGQITKGAPFDVFLSADVERPQRLEQNGLAHSRVTYALGQLVLWPSTSPIEQKLTKLEGKLVIANPRLAPYGKAAQSVLKHLLLEHSFNRRLIKAHNVNQAFQFVDSGNAPAGILSKSQLIHASLAFNTRILNAGEAKSKDKNKYNQYQNIPTEWHQPIAQQAVIVSASGKQAEAKQFIAWLLSTQVQQQLTQLGYGLSDG